MSLLNVLTLSIKSKARISSKLNEIIQKYPEDYELSPHFHIINPNNKEFINDVIGSVEVFS